MGLVAVINLKGGTAMGMEPEEIEGKFAEAFGTDVPVRFARGDELPDVMDGAFADKSFDRIIVAGGDGTASLAAKCAARHDKCFGLVPLGTMNLFARTIGMPLDTDEALAALADGEVRRVDCGEANGDVFVNHVSLGFHPQLVRMRDAFPRGGRVKRMLNGFRVYWRHMAVHERLRLNLSGDFDSFGAEAGLVVVSVNPIQEGVAAIPHPDDQRRGEFGLYVSTHKSAWDLNKVVWRLLNGTLLESEHVTFRRTRTVTIEADHALHVSLDGEVSVRSSPLECRMFEGRLKVLAPRSGSAETDGN